MTFDPHPFSQPQTRRKKPSGAPVAIAIAAALAIVVGVGVYAIRFRERAQAQPVEAGKPAEPAAETKAVPIEAGELADQFAENAIRAEGRHKGRRLNVTGRIVAVGSTENETAYIVVAAYNDIPPAEGVRCVFSAARRGDVAKLGLRQRATIGGVCGGAPADGDLHRGPSLSECRIVAREK